MTLPPGLDMVHNVFYKSMHKKYIRDGGHIIPDYRELNNQHDATYEEEPVRILEKQNKVQRRRTIPLIKVL